MSWIINLIEVIIIKAIIVSNKGYEGILEIGETYEIKEPTPNKLYIKVNGTVINLKTVTYKRGWLTWKQVTW